MGLAVNWASYAIAQANAPVAHTAFLISMTPLFLIPLTAVLDRTPVPRTVLVGAVLATIGVWLLVSQYQDDGVYPTVLLGDAFALLAAAGYAVFAWLLGRGMRTFSPVTAVCVAQYSTTPTLALVALLAGAWGIDFAALTVGDWTHLVIVQALGGAAAPVLFFVAVSILGAVRAGMILYLQPVLGALLGAALLGERIGLSTALGGALILAAVVLSQAPSRRPRTS
jgi:drug/metabolite transporter (DMT)-like permease